MAKIVKRTIGTGDTRYVVDFYDLSGKRRKERFRRERDAKARLGEVLAQRETGELRPRAADVPFREVVADWKLSHWGTIRDSTQTVYDRVLDEWLLPQLGARKLRTITLRDCEQLIATLVASVGTRKRAKGGRVTANIAAGLLKQIFSYAEMHRLVASSVARHLKRRAAPFEERREKLDRDVLAPDELRKLVDAADGIYKVLLLTAGLTGLRRGELFGLKWDDIDWASARLHVRRQATNGELRAPKSPAALRTVPLPVELVSALKPWRLRCPKGELNLVFPNPRGGLLVATTVDEQGLHPALRRAGLRHVTLHGLRHTYASMLISAGVSLKFVQRAMGHSSITITLNVYAHLLPDDAENAAALLSAKVFGRTGNFSGTSAPESPANRAATGP